jgi:cell division protein FtsZ
VLLQGVSGITDLITTPGLINLDFADVRSVMKGAGSALMGIGMARGENRAAEAARNAIASPLLEASIDGAKGVLLSIAGGSDLGLFEINEAARLVADVAHPEANIIFGTVIDDTLGDEVRVTVIAAGFDSYEPSNRPWTPTGAANDKSEDPEIPDFVNANETTGPQPVIKNDFDATEVVTPRRVVFDDTADDELDIPDFLR